MSTPPIEGELQEPLYLEEEQRENAVSLREKQVRMEQQVYRIWTYVPSLSPSKFVSQLILLKRSISVRRV